MARYKPYSYAQGKFIPVFFDRQIQPGTFEYTLNHLIDSELDLSVFNDRFQNDETGAPAYDPKILLKIIVFAYSRGIVSSRKIAQCCEENIIFMALSADTRPHFTTIADFISSLDNEIVKLFLKVLLVCDEQGLIGREMFAIDGCKLPSNASKEWCNTRAGFVKKAAKMEKAIGRMLTKHRENDHAGIDRELAAKEEKYIKTLHKRARKVREWLAGNADKIGKMGKPVKSNITDNESAKMMTSKGVIQGYDGITAVDGKHQVIVHAEAFGQSQEHDLLRPMVDGTRENFKAFGDEDVFTEAKLTADAGFHTEENMKMLFAGEIDAYVADGLFRNRDPRFADYERFKERHRRERARIEGRKGLFKTEDFTFVEDLSHCICPAGKRLYRGGRHCNLRGFTAVNACPACSAPSACGIRTALKPGRLPISWAVMQKARNDLPKR